MKKAKGEGQGMKKKGNWRVSAVFPTSSKECVPMFIPLQALLPHAVNYTNHVIYSITVPPTHTHTFFFNFVKFYHTPLQKKKNPQEGWLESELFLTSVIRKWVPTCLWRWWVFTVKHTWSTLESLAWGISTCWSFFVCVGCRWGCLTAHGAGEGPWRQVSEALLWCD